MNPKRRPLRDDLTFLDRVERELAKTFKRYLYDPILKILKGTDVLQNASNKALFEALRTGRIKYWDGKFTGRFSAEISKELKALGARWYAGTASFKLKLENMPPDVKDYVYKINQRMVDRLALADKVLAAVDPNAVVEHFKAKNLFIKAIKTSEDDVQSLAGKLAIKPKAETMKVIAKDWSYNIDSHIMDWTKTEVKRFRQDISGLIMQGKRFGTKQRPGELEAEIMDRYGARIRESIYPGKQLEELTEKERKRIENKAYFIARNETNLLMSSYKYQRMQDAGSTFFKWLTVVGSKESPVRPSHKVLDNKVFRWDDPPIDTQLNRPVLPKQAYNCRCTAVPLWDKDIAKDAKGNFKKIKTDGVEHYVLK